MNLWAEEETTRSDRVHLTPMVDFLFLIVAVLAVVAMSKNGRYEHTVDLVQASSAKTANRVDSVWDAIDLSVSREGTYRWHSNNHNLHMDTPAIVHQALLHYRQLNPSSADTKNIKVFIHIDKEAHWQPIAELFLAIRHAGLTPFPVYASPHETDSITGM